MRWRDIEAGQSEKEMCKNCSKWGKNVMEEQYLCTGRLREYSNMLLSNAICFSWGFEALESFDTVDSNGFAI